jgi:hypothetical protein
LEEGDNRITVTARDSLAVVALEILVTRQLPVLPLFAVSPLGLHLDAETVSASFSVWNESSILAEYRVEWEAEWLQVRPVMALVAGPEAPIVHQVTIDRGLLPPDGEISDEVAVVPIDAGVEPVVVTVTVDRLSDALLPEVVDDATDPDAADPLPDDELDEVENGDGVEDEPSNGSSDADIEEENPSNPSEGSPSGAHATRSSPCGRLDVMSMLLVLMLVAGRLSGGTRR